MGCCCSHLAVDSDVRLDPSVSSHIEVDDIAITIGVRKVRRVAMSYAVNSVMYIEGDLLHYETRHTKTLCGTFYKHYVFQLSRIEVVDMFEYVTFPVGLCYRRNIQLSPGLRISVNPNITVLVSMPVTRNDAEKFARVLAEASNTTARAVLFGGHVESYKLLLPKARRKKKARATASAVQGNDTNKTNKNQEASGVAEN